MSLFDHLVGYGEHAWRNGQAKKFRGLYIDDQLEFRGLRDWQVCRLFAFENAAHIDACLTIPLGDAETVANKAA